MEKFGVSENGRIDRKARAGIFTNIEEKMKKMGFADLNSNPKHGTMTIPAATGMMLSGYALNCRTREGMGRPRFYGTLI